MDYAHLVLLFVAIGVIAFLCSSVGHAGASSYIATMTLWGSIPSLGFTLAAAAIIGGTVGSHLGSRRFAVRVISFLLAIVLLIAGMKVIFTP